VFSQPVAFRHGLLDDRQSGYDSGMNRSGRHFLQIPGPTNVPERVLQAMARATIDHRGPDFPDLAREVFEGLRRLFRSSGALVVFPSSGTGGWEAALVNTLSPGDRVLAFETGEFARLWADVARRLGLAVDVVDSDWRRGVDPDAVERALTADDAHGIKAVLVVHNETSTGVTSRIPQIRQAIDRARHPALLLVDAVSSLASIDLRHDEWGIDVTISGSQKGLMLPPGLALHAISDKALRASTSAALPRSYWSWDAMLASNTTGYFPYTPATNLLYGLREALRMLDEEGLPNVFARHARLAEGARRAVGGWGLELCAAHPDEYSNTVTTVLMPAGADADHLRRIVLERFNMSLGTGLGRLKGRAFRLGHLGDFNELMLCGMLCGVEMGLSLAGVPIARGGVDAAMRFLEDAHAGSDAAVPLRA
jgi:alanine-glyoxylate transaminase/serine-glyoxylate transaminase/serine-pyruvate transaminase